MKKVLTIHWQAGLIYLFFLGLVQLGSIHIGGAFSFLFVFLLLLPLVSIIQAAATFFRLKYRQDFSTVHPLKGETISYTLTIHNESNILTSKVTVIFKKNRALGDDIFNATETIFKPGENRNIQYRFICPYRGIYEIGLEKIEITDALGWLTLRPKVWAQTLYVYPRIVSIRPPFEGARESGHRSSRYFDSSGLDFAHFEGFSPYRSGQGVRNIYWRKMAAQGIAVLKNFGKEAHPGITIYLDLLREEEWTQSTLAREDCSIEIAVALVHFYLSNGIPVSLYAPSAKRGVFHYTGNTLKDFEFFHNETINLFFGETIQAGRLFLTNNGAGSLSNQSVLFITHRIDPEMISLLETSLQNEGFMAAILNLTGLDQEEKSKKESYFIRLREKGGNVVLIHDTETIAEDMRRGYGG